MAQVPATIETLEDIGLVKLAREIAINHFPVETILERYQITPENWETVKASPRFQQLLEHEIQEWNGALNTHQRTSLKAAAMIEEYLPEGNSRLHDSRENLPAKVELLKLLAKIARMDSSGDGGGGSGEKFSVTINLGNDQKLTFEKKVIDVTPDNPAA